MLRNRHNNRLVVHRRVLGTQPIKARGDALVHRRAHDAVLQRRVDSLEEYERGRVQCDGRVERWELFDHAMRVPDDDAVAVELLRRGVVILLGVGEVARLCSPLATETMISETKEKG
jgi:hypothetical protein